MSNKEMLSPQCFQAIPCDSMAAKILEMGRKRKGFVIDEEIG